MSSDNDSDIENGSEQSSVDINVPLKGKIYSVNAQNFITFTDTTVYPGEELNILIGPNGTGKSSMVAAIVIGMGGTTKVLSTAKMHLSNYVKNGKERATITICLYKNEKGDLYTFSRSFGLDNKSIYKIDGKKVMFDFDESFVRVVSTNCFVIFFSRTGQRRRLFGCGAWHEYSSRQFMPIPATRSCSRLCQAKSRRIVPQHAIVGVQRRNLSSIRKID